VSLNFIERHSLSKLFGVCYHVWMWLEMKFAIASAYIASSVVWFDSIAMCCRAYTESNHNMVWLHSIARCFNVLPAPFRLYISSAGACGATLEQQSTLEHRAIESSHTTLWLDSVYAMQHIAIESNHKPHPTRLYISSTYMSCIIKWISHHAIYSVEPHCRCNASTPCIHMRWLQSVGSIQL